MYTFEELKKQTAFVDTANREEILNFEERKELNWYLEKRIFDTKEVINDLENKSDLSNEEQHRLVGKQIELHIFIKITEDLQKLL